MSKLVVKTDGVMIYTAYDSDGTVRDLTTASKVEIVLVNPGRTKLIAGPYIASSSHADADFVHGVAAVNIPRADALLVGNREVLADMQLTEGGKLVAIVADETISVIRWLFP
jgi:hypothetical protein